MHSRGTLLPIDAQIHQLMQQVLQPQSQKRPSILQLHIPSPQKSSPRSLVGWTADGGPKSRSADFEDEQSSQEYFPSNASSVNNGSTRFDDAYIESPPVFTPVL